MNTLFAPSLLVAIAEQSSSVDLLETWPVESLQLLQKGGVAGWSLPVEFGGQPLEEVDLLRFYLELTPACLTTSFVFTQHHAAVHRLMASGNRDLQCELLPGVARGELWMTVGISHLSTSRQHWRKPSVVATSTDWGWWLDGEIPWVTGAAHADWLLIGGTLDTGEGVLGLVPRQTPGLTVSASHQMLALTGSATASVRLDKVELRRERLVNGPTLKPLQVGAKGGTGSLTTSAVALGHAFGSIRGFEEEAARQEGLSEAAAAFAVEAEELRVELLAAATEPPPVQKAEGLRFRANSLAIRAAQAYLAACKGAGFLRGHPAERKVRESMFFQVWSCPPNVVRAAVNSFSCAVEM